MCLVEYKNLALLRKVMGSCNICGTKTDKLFKTEIEGTEMIVCEECSNYGKVISKMYSDKPKKKIFVQTKEPEKQIEERVVFDFE